jgi:hypothetical protein
MWAIGGSSMAATERSTSSDSVGVAGAVALGLGVLDDLQRLVRVGFLFEVDVAVAVQVLDHRHARFGQQAGDQALAAARHDDVDEFAHGDQLADRSTVSGIDDLDAFGGQAGGLQAFLDQCGDGAVAADGFRAAAQDGRVAGLQAQRGSVGGDVRTGFVDDADDAKRHAHLADLDARWHELELTHFANRVGQLGHLFDTFGHAVDALFRQCQAVEHGGFEAGGTGGGKIFGIGGDQRGFFAADGGGDVQQCGVLFRGRCGGEAARGSAGLAADSLHVVLDIHGFVRRKGKGTL